MALGILDCKDGTIVKPVMLNTRKGERERYFYELVNETSTNNKYYDVSMYSVELLRTLRKFTPVFKGFVTLAEHPNGKIRSIASLNVGSLKLLLALRAWET